VPQVRPSFGLTWVSAGAWKLNWSGQPEIVVSEYPADQREPLPRACPEPAEGLASKTRTRTWGTRLEIRFFRPDKLMKSLYNVVLAIIYLADYTGFLGLLRFSTLDLRRGSSQESMISSTLGRGLIKCS
jgi:hypothetical protein